MDTMGGTTRASTINYFLVQDSTLTWSRSFIPLNDPIIEPVAPGARPRSRLVGLHAAGRRPLVQDHLQAPVAYPLRSVALVVVAPATRRAVRYLHWWRGSVKKCVLGVIVMLRRIAILMMVVVVVVMIGARGRGRRLQLRRRLDLDLTSRLDLGGVEELPRHLVAARPEGQAARREFKVSSAKV